MLGWVKKSKCMCGREVRARVRVGRREEEGVWYGAWGRTEDLHVDVADGVWTRIMGST